MGRRLRHPKDTRKVFASCLRIAFTSNPFFMDDNPPLFLPDWGFKNFPSRYKIDSNNPFTQSSQQQCQQIFPKL
jgi:hypothetical protein